MWTCTFLYICIMWILNIYEITSQVIGRIIMNLCSGFAPSWSPSCCVYEHCCVLGMAGVCRSPAVPGLLCARSWSRGAGRSRSCPAASVSGGLGTAACGTCTQLEGDDYCGWQNLRKWLLQQLLELLAVLQPVRWLWLQLSCKGPALDTSSARPYCTLAVFIEALLLKVHKICEARLTEGLAGRGFHAESHKIAGLCGQDSSICGN